jgi:predicted RNA-binding protein YlxR (DUF448 family)
MADAIRTCAVCGVKKPKAELLRFVWKNGVPEVDHSGGAAGRGAYCCEISCRDRLLQQNKKWKRLFRL